MVNMKLACEIPGRRRATLRFAGGCFAALLLLAASCARIAEREERAPDGSLIVEFWHAMSGGHQSSLLEIVAAFNQSHPGVKIVPVYQGSYDSLSQKLVASCISGSNPPVSQMYESWTTRFMSRNLIAAAEDLAAANPDGPDARFDDIFPAFIEDNSWPVDGRKKLMTLPFNKSIYVLYMNEDRMKAAGFENPPADWDEWRDLAEKMTERGPDGSIKTYGFATRPFLESFTTNLFLRGPKYIDDNGEFDFAGPEGLQALRFLVDLTWGEKRAGYVETDYLSNVFGAEKIAMFVGSTASFPFMDRSVQGKFSWRAYPLPAPKGAQGRALCQGTNVGVFANHPESVRRAAWEFLVFLTNTENTVKWALETGYLPVRRSALEHGKMKEYLAKDVNYSAALSQVERGLFEPKVIYWESCRLAIGREVEAALNNRKSPEDALAAALKKCEYIKKTE